MSSNNQNNSESNNSQLNEGYQPLNKGHKPSSSLDTSKPPQGGSGVPPKKTEENSKNEVKE